MSVRASLRCTACFCHSAGLRFDKRENLLLCLHLAITASSGMALSAASGTARYAMPTLPSQLLVQGTPAELQSALKRKDVVVCKLNPGEEMSLKGMRADAAALLVHIYHVAPAFGLARAPMFAFLTHLDRFRGSPCLSAFQRLILSVCLCL